MADDIKSVVNHPYWTHRSQVSRNIGPYDNGALSAEQQEKIDHMKLHILRDTQKYFATHHQVKGVVSLILTELMLKQPLNVHLAAADLVRDTDFKLKLKKHMEHLMKKRHPAGIEDARKCPPCSPILSGYVCKPSPDWSKHYDDFVVGRMHDDYPRKKENARDILEELIDDVDTSHKLEQNISEITESIVDNIFKSVDTLEKIPRKEDFSEVHEGIPADTLTEILDNVGVYKDRNKYFKTIVNDIIGYKDTNK